MNVEIINVGTELLLGEIVNTNATLIQKMCKELGFSVYFQSVVGDNPQRFLDCLEIAFNRGADCVITTGGLGPTADDLTKELSAQFLDLPMEYDEVEAQKVYDKCAFVSNSTNVPSTNFKQAYFPKGCFILDNEVGTANGCVMTKDQRMIVNLPGPPKELSYVMENVLKPYLAKYKQDTIYTYDINTMGIGESNMALLLKDIVDSQTEVSIALYALEDHCRVRLGVVASSKEESDKKMLDTRQAIEKILEPYIVDYYNLKSTINQLMPEFYIVGNHPVIQDMLPFFKEFHNYQGHLINKQDNPQILNLCIDVEEVKLGQYVIITIDSEARIKETIPLLKDAKLSISRLNGKITIVLYKWLTKIA